MPTPAVGERRSPPPHTHTKGRCEVSLLEEGRLDFGPAKAIEEMMNTPPALTFDASSASCLPGWGQRTAGFLHKKAVFELGLKGHMGWLQGAERCWVSREQRWMSTRVCLGAAETSLVGQWVCEDWSVKVCWDQMGPSRIWVLPPDFPASPILVPLGINISGGNLPGAGRLCLQVSDAHLPPGVPGLCRGGLLQHGQLQVLR